MADADRDKIARAVIKEALQLDETEQRAAVDRARKELKDAEHRLRELHKAGSEGLIAWRKRGELDRLIALKALTLAQIKDLAEPSGHYTAAVTGYLAEHHPPTADKTTNNTDIK